MKSLKSKSNNKTRRNTNKGCRNKRVARKTKCRKSRNRNIMGGVETKDSTSAAAPDQNKHQIREIDETDLSNEDIKRINEYLDKRSYKNDPNASIGMTSQLNGLMANSGFLQYLKTNNIFDKFAMAENPKKKVKIVFYASKGKKNGSRKYPNFKVFIENPNSLSDTINQVDDMMSFMVDPALKKRSDLYKRTIDIDIEDFAKAVEIQETAKRNAKIDNERKGK